MRNAVLAALMAAAAFPPDAPAAEAVYLANEGVLIRDADTAVLFDPLFDNDYGRYRLLPDDMREKLFAGDPPFDGIDAVFVSHAHGDHFSATQMLAYLRARPDVRLYAPAQAVAALRAEAGGGHDPLFGRVTGIAMDNGDPPMELSLESVGITVMRVPHSGWPDRMTDIQNLVFSVAIRETTSIAHFGDADPDPDHFAANAGTWADRETDLAMPPYWFFLSPGGRRILDEVVRPKQAVGMHVPVDVPRDVDARPADLRDYALFTEPGEQRDIP